MNTTDKKHLLKWNTILWLAAMALPAFFSVALASTKFPWPMIVPLLLIGPMLYSNKVLSSASGGSTVALKWNTLLWLAAMLLPAFFRVAFASAKFPWPMILPLLLIGPMLYSNKMLAQAIGDSTVPATPK